MQFRSPGGIPDASTGCSASLTFLNFPKIYYRLNFLHWTLVNILPNVGKFFLSQPGLGLLCLGPLSIKFEKI